MKQSSLVLSKVTLSAVVKSALVVSALVNSSGAVLGPLAQMALTHNNVFAGNSYIAGNGATGLNGSFVSQVQRGNIINNAPVTNSGVAGQTIANMRSNRATQIDAFYVAGKKNVLHLMEMRNTICAVNSTTTGAQAWAQMKLLISEVLAVHPDWVIVLYSTIATYSNFAAGLTVTVANNELLNADALMLAEGPSLAGVAAVVNLRENSQFVWQGGSNLAAAQVPFYNGDQVHPNEEGYALFKASSENAMRSAEALRVTSVVVPELPVLSSYVEQSGSIRIKISQPASGGLVDKYVVTTADGTVITDSAVGTNGWDRTISGLANGVAKQLVITPINSAGTGPALTTAALTPKAVTTQLYNFEADTVGAAPANITAINGALVVSNTGTGNATKSIYMPAQPADTKAGVFEMTNMVPQAADQKLTFKRTCAVAGAADTQFFAVRLQNALSTAVGFESFRCGYYVRVRATGLLRLYRLDAAALVQIQSDVAFNQAIETSFEVSIVEGLFQVKANNVVKASKLDFTYPDGRNLIRFEVGDASVAYLDDMQLVS